MFYETQKSLNMVILTWINIKINEIFLPSFCRYSKVSTSGVNPGHISLQAGRTSGAWERQVTKDDCAAKCRPVGGGAGWGAREDGGGWPGTTSGAAGWIWAVIWRKNCQPSGLIVNTSDELLLPAAWPPCLSHLTQGSIWLHWTSFPSNSLFLDFKHITPSHFSSYLGGSSFSGSLALFFHICLSFNLGGFQSSGLYPFSLLSMSSCSPGELTWYLALNATCKLVSQTKTPSSDSLS